MARCCGGDAELNPTDPRTAPEPACSGSSPAAGSHPVFDWFARMIPNCLDYAQKAKDEARPVVGIMCEYTPRELILAAGAVPVCLCGGSEATIPDAEFDLPANLCPLIKSTYGYHVQQSNPFLETADLIVAETTCDGKKKMFELMAQTRPMHILELPQKPDDPDAANHWHRELVKLKAELERRFHVTITDEKIRQAAELMNRERSLRRQLGELMQADSPPLTGRQLLELKSSISGIPGDLARYEQALAELPHAPGPDRSDRVRVLLTGVPMPHGAERVAELIEDSGGLVVAADNCTGLKPILEDVDLAAPDITRAVADKYFHIPCSVMTPNEGRFTTIRELAEKYRVQCVVELIWQACLTYDVEAARVKRFAEQELGLPYLRINTDYARADSSRIAVRLEALFETVRSGADVASCHP